MLHYFKFRQDLFAPAAAKDVYVKRGAGKGWPEECPPIRAANAFGFDLLANFDVTFVRGKAGLARRGRRRHRERLRLRRARTRRGQAARAAVRVVLGEGAEAAARRSRDNVYEQISNQVKVSTYLFLKTDPNELLLFTDVPNLARPWRAMTALVDTDWYPASYPWHVVIELPPGEKRVTIKRASRCAG